jgi:hypothetical protein
MHQNEVIQECYDYDYEHSKTEYYHFLHQPQRTHSHYANQEQQEYYHQVPYYPTKTLPHQGYHQAHQKRDEKQEEEHVRHQDDLSRAASNSHYDYVDYGYGYACGYYFREVR